MSKYKPGSKVIFKGDNRNALTHNKVYKVEPYIYGKGRILGIVKNDRGQILLPDDYDFQLYVKCNIVKNKPLEES